ncbi:uncharacterized protein LOC118202735 [Stegodyphus dumicola]|uniref:uncharacterized protein LOC118202735 n=1 Tax=Stegodyphus dumicola TaxID=202533 RepID=UPI0015AB463C|nr:uncharacterized protein LOC118202735 [Stegodyphus dumicola]
MSRSCGQFVVAAEHRCYLRRVAPKKSDDKFIFFDFETDQSSGEHLVNFAVAQYADGTEKVFPGYEACQDFCAWLFTPQHKGFTAVAHNMKGFDGQFVMAWLLEQGTAPEVIPNGSMIMSVRHPSLNIRVIDSLNFLPMALSKLPGCFGLSELKKGYFPHLFNARENQNYVGPLPEIHYYSPDTMSTSARQAFLASHDAHKGDVFDFQAEMLAYCRSDVDILRRCCLEFRAQFLDVAGVDPFQYVTIGSACMATYRIGHIQPDTIAMVPTHGYINLTHYSPDSIRWLDFVAYSEGLKIQHALNGSGEHKIAGISVDGFLPRNTNRLSVSGVRKGCFFHGCSSCYDGDIIHPLERGFHGNVEREKTEETTRKLRTQGLTVIEMWEHEFQRQNEENLDLQAFLDQHHLRDRLNPRESFFGGRTNALKLFHEGDVNKYCVYPVGHPTIITESFRRYGRLLWTYPMPCDSSTESVSSGLLPYRCRKKLMFPLCRTCALLQLQTPCTHTDDDCELLSERGVSEEVKLAKKKGYHCVTHIKDVFLLSSHA